MRIRDVMTKNPITVDSETLVLDAQKIMKENSIRRLPVVDKGNLVGIVTQHDLLQASPSPATSLSIHELNYLLARMKVKEIMKKNPMTLTPDTPFEEALKMGQDKKIGSFPVVENGKSGWHCDRIGYCQVPDPRVRDKGRRVEGYDRGTGRKVRRSRENYCDRQSTPNDHFKYDLPPEAGEKGLDDRSSTQNDRP